MPTAKKKPIKKVAKKTVHDQRSFVRSKEAEPFFTFRTTHQTVYWLIISLLVLAVGVWVLHLTVRVDDLYNEVQTHSSSDETMTIKKK
jgi:thiosulfate reductase cytochrome b subunit